MSGNATVAVWRYRDDALTAVDRYVLLALADEADSAGYIDGRARRSAPHIAEKTHLSRRTVDRTLKRLVAMDLVNVVTAPVRGGKNGGEPGDYHLPMVTMSNRSDDPDDRVTNRVGHTVQSDADRASSRDNPGSSPGTSDVPPSDVTSSDAEATRLAELLADLIEQNGSKRPTVTKSWVTEIDRMIRLDSRSVDLVEKCIRWAQADSFWRANIMSPGKLRKHYDRLRLASIAAKQQNGNGRALDPIGDHLALRFDDEGGLIR